MANEKAEPPIKPRDRDRIRTRGEATSPPGPDTTRDESQQINYLVNVVGKRGTVEQPVPTQTVNGIHLPGSTKTFTLLSIQLEKYQ
jgi:hypothetical protein